MATEGSDGSKRRTSVSADMLREVIGRCPTHALHVEEHSA